MPRLFVHAINVHQGGGAVLLHDLLRAIPLDVEAFVHVDARMRLPVDLPDHVRVVRVEPTLFGRFTAERRLAGRVAPDDRVLCFGNLPPLFKLRGEVSVFLQNRYLVDPHAPLSALPLRMRCRLLFERAWLECCRSHAKKYFVQTASMQRMAEEKLGISVECVPFIPASVLREAANGIRKSAHHHFDFIYVASGEAHKNHSVLLSAWRILADEGLFPSLALTVSPEVSPDLCGHIQEAIKSFKLRIDNLGALPHEDLLELYRKSGALIYPSSFESFGLPLLEASQAGLPILAAELDYVRDIIDPAESFDQLSPVSIARAVRRFLEVKRPMKKLHRADELITKILAGVRQ